MPHDRSGHLISVGDTINIPCIVKSIQTGNDYCNVTVETVEVMPPENKYTNTYTLNTRQIDKVSSY